MKVVLFCGGQGMRMREASETVPKPMILLGNRPILWHVMKYYAHWGVTDFILCLGYKAEVIKQYFLQYDEALSNDFVLSNGGRDVELLASDISDWSITFVDTGPRTSIGQRLRAVRHLVDDDVFLANYGDVLTDAPLPDIIERSRHHDASASFLAVRPSHYSFHVVDFDEDGRVSGLHDVNRSSVWINGGYFVLTREFLEQLGPDEDLVDAPFQRLAAEGRLLAQRYEGFWAPMDTLKDQQMLEQMQESGTAPWRVWEGVR